MNKISISSFKDLLKDSKKRNLIIITLTFLLFIGISATYAYFTAQVTGGTGANINASTGTTDSLMFAKVKDIDLKVEVSDFGIGGDNLTREAISSASLKANNTTNQASASYNAFLLIDNNDFVYTTETYKPELIVKIYDPNGNEVTDIEGLKRAEGGFDITTRTGGFLIRSDYDINVTGNDAEIQEWKAEVTLVNLDTDQRGNMGKHFSARLYLTKEKLSTYEPPLVNSININDEEKTSSSMIARMNVTEGTENIEKYFFAIEEVESGIAYSVPNYGLKRLVNTDTELDWKETDQPYYEFKNLTPNTAYKIYSYAMDKNGTKSNEYVTEEPITTNEYLKPSILDVTFTNTLESITVNVNASKGENEIAKYFYSINDGEYIESTESTYTFNNLKDTTSYKIKIKVNDTKEEFSTEFIKPNAETEKYILPNITKVDKVTTYNSATLTVTATNGHGEVNGNYEIREYWYQINDGEWTQASNNVISLNSLLEQTNYSVNIKVKDAYEKESEVYPVTVTTDAYEIPTVTATVPTNTITSNSFTINATATNGNGTITKYMYSKDGGSNWVTVNSTSLTNNYTFDNLTPGATFQVKVKVVDSNNRESEVVSIPNITTLNVFTNNTSNYTGTYNGTAQTLTMNVTPASGRTIYYSTTTELNESNYTSGTTTLPTRTDAGTTTVYWCAVKTGYTTLCSSNTITINRANPTISSATSTIAAGSTTSYITYTGDVTPTCSPSDGTYASCSVDSTNKRITFTRKKVGSGSFTVSMATGTNYNSLSKTVTVTVSGYTPSLSSTTVALGTNDSASITYTGDGTPSCGKASGTYVNCSVSGKTITFTRKSYSSNGSETISISATAGANYKSLSSTNISVSVEKQNPTLATYIKSLYTSQGSNGIYYHTSSLANSAEDGSYRYAGADPNNYVCFGSTASTCPNNNLYRIIGVFGENIKLIKADLVANGLLSNYEGAYASSSKPNSSEYKGTQTTIDKFYWASGLVTDTNNWSESKLNYINLNSSFISNIGYIWSNKISTTEWNIGGYSSPYNEYDVPVKTFYNAEKNTKYYAKIGLITPSEYGYAASPENWTTALSSYSGAKNNNWMYIGENEWTITNSSSDYIFYIMGNLYRSWISNAATYGVRPAFSLDSSITYVSGSGSSTDPMRIN